MKVYSGKGLGDMYYALIREITANGKEIPTRHGPCLELQEPVTLEYCKPGACWMTIPDRMFNPFFALAEVVWILSGNGDVEWISYFNSNMKKFADSGKKDFNGAYGLRMRRWPSCIGNYVTVDQLSIAINKLKREPLTRQAVVSLWDPERDNIRGSNDYPCNNLLYFRLRDGILNMTVTQRSCDLIWGAPYNAVQFSHVHAYAAGCLGVKIGTLTYVIDNLHYYLELYPVQLAKLIEKAFIETALAQASITAECAPGFGPIGEPRFEYLSRSIENLLTLKPEQFSSFLTNTELVEYWGQIIPRMIWIYRAVKEGGISPGWIGAFILNLPPLFQELVLTYYAGCSYGTSKQVYSICVRELDEKEKKGWANQETKEAEGTEGSNEANNPLPPQTT